MAKLAKSRLSTANEVNGNLFFKDGKPLSVSQVQEKGIDITNYLAVWLDDKALGNVSVCKTYDDGKWVSDKSLAWSLVSYLHKANDRQAVCAVRVAEYTDEYVVHYEDSELHDDDYMHNGTTAFERTMTIYVIGSSAPRKVGFIKMQDVIGEFLDTEGNILIKPKISLKQWLEALGKSK